MLCYFVRKKFSSYYDGMAKEDEKAKIEEHFKVCSLCREEYQLFKGDLGILKSLDLVSAPDYLWDKIKEKMKGETKILYLRGKSISRYVVSLGLTSLSILILISTSYFYYSTKIENEKIINFLFNSNKITIDYSALDIETNYDLLLE